MNTDNECAGRRKRAMRDVRMALDEVDKSDLHSSISGTDVDDLTNKEAGADSQSKYFFTIWSTSSSTIVLTETSIKSANTVSISAACTIANAIYSTCAG